MTKPTKWHVRPASETPKTGFLVRGLNRFRQIEPPNDKTAQTDRSLPWAHSHFVGFVMRRLNSYFSNHLGSHICPSRGSHRGTGWPLRCDIRGGNNLPYCPCRGYVLCVESVSELWFWA